MTVHMEAKIVAKVLVVDDVDNIRRFVATVVTSLGHDIVTAADGVHGLELIKAHSFDIVITDENMGGGDKDGSRMMIRAKEAGRPLKRVIAMSDKFIYHNGDEKLEAQLREKWGVAWLILLPKPFSLDNLETAIQTLLAMPA